MGFWMVLTSYGGPGHSSQADRITLGSQTHRCHPPWGTVVGHLWAQSAMDFMELLGHCGLIQRNPLGH